MRKGLSISIRLAHILLAGGWMGWAGTPSARGQLRIEMNAAYNLVVDSNAGTPSSYAPKAAYLGATFWNDGTQALTDVWAYIGDYANGMPGVYPSRSHLTLAGPLPGG